MGRGIWIVVVLAACAPRGVREPLPAGPARVTLDDGGAATVRGELRARDADAWYAIEVPSTIECPRVAVELRARTPRPRLAFAVALYDHERHRLDVGRARAAVFSGGRGGRYFARVYAPHADAAGAFVLDVRAAQYGCDAMPDPPLVLHRPAAYQPPAIAPSIDREVAGVLAIQTYEGRGTVELDSTAVAPGWIGHLVDDHGDEVPGSAFAITEVRAHASVGELVAPWPVAARADRGEALWTAVITRPTAPP